MQPDASVQLAGLRRILEQVVAPAVGDAFAAAQLRAVAEALDELAAHWPRAAALLELEHADLRARVAEVAAQLRAPDAPPLAQALREQIRAVEREPAPGAGALAERTRGLRALQAELIRALAAAPPSPGRDALRARVRRALRAQLDRAAEG